MPDLTKMNEQLMALDETWVTYKEAIPEEIKDEELTAQIETVEQVIGMLAGELGVLGEMVGFEEPVEEVVEPPVDNPMPKEPVVV